MVDKYVKIVYQSKPIGEEQIILYLTTFDYDAYEKDQNPIKKEVINFAVRQNAPYDYIEQMLNDYVQRYYGYYVDEIRRVLETKKIMDNAIDLNAKNISNSGDVHCGKVYGNISNCDNIYCTEIKGNIVNCDKIVYKK